ncbi:DUF6896 domain-containing protein [Pimelobacter simplex]|uniref:DUF6896 domain-containing protein n=1 Tax=Nocardioides simplex TaxID=2045 RepID=UPI003AB033E8
MTPQQIVSSFVEITERCLDALLGEYGGRPPVRTGVLDGRVRFQLHGIGCRFELDDGTDVDVDWDDNGYAVFDSWRILMYAHSIGDERVERDELRVAAAEHPRLTQVTPDWFTWSDGRYALGRRQP